MAGEMLVRGGADLGQPRLRHRVPEAGDDPQPGPVHRHPGHDGSTWPGGSSAFSRPRRVRQRPGDGDRGGGGDQLLAFQAGVDRRRIGGGKDGQDPCEQVKAGLVVHPQGVP